MSEQPQTHIPEWDLADRMRKALRDAEMSVQEMADYLEVNRNTVGNWINGHTRAPSASLRLWALRCGVPYEWLRHGDAGRPFAGPGGAGASAEGTTAPSTDRSSADSFRVLVAA